MQRFIPAEERGWDELLYWLIFPLFLYSVQQVAIPCERDRGSYQFFMCLQKLKQSPPHLWVACKDCIGWVRRSHNPPFFLSQSVRLPLEGIFQTSIC